MSETIAKLLNQSCVLINCNYTKAEEVISAVGIKLFEEGYVRDTFVKAAIDREKQLPTGLPLAGGINAAIPHTEIEHVIKSALGMATLKTPATFQNMISPEELVPVRLVFLLALEKPKAQVEMLQEIASVLQNSVLVEDLLNENTYEGIIKLLKQA
jgi:PTS system galactitol-specific IIA component